MTTRRRRSFSPEFKAQIPKHMQTLFLGKAHWTREPKYRSLADPVDPRKFTLKDAWRPRKAGKAKKKAGKEKP